MNIKTVEIKKNSKRVDGDENGYFLGILFLIKPQYLQFTTVLCSAEANFLREAK